MSRILVSGSIATDVIMNFHDQFGNYILPDRTDKLSVNFNIGHLVRHAGGAGHNIAYNLALLGEQALLVGAVGYDFSVPPQCEDAIDYTYVTLNESYATACAHIITDAQNNQITAFYPGAIIESMNGPTPWIDEDIAVAMISPNHPLTMMRHLRMCMAKDIPTFFDPGQPLTAFSKEQLREVMALTDYLIVNEYEKELFCRLAACTFEDLTRYFKRVVVTYGERGSICYGEGEEIVIEAFPVEKIIDPTGCGDAYRAGLLRGLYHEHSRQESMIIGSFLASRCVQQQGTMEHTL